MNKIYKLLDVLDDEDRYDMSQPISIHLNKGKLNGILRSLAKAAIEHRYDDGEWTNYWSTYNVIQSIRNKTPVFSDEVTEYL